MSIKKSLRIALIISSIIPVFIISIIAHGLLTQRLYTVQTKNLQMIAETNLQVIEAMLETQRTELSLLSTQSDIQGLVRISNYTDNYSSTNITYLLNERVNRNNYSEAITLYNTNGTIVAYSNKNILDTNNSFNQALSYINNSNNTAVWVSGVSTKTLDGNKLNTIEMVCPIIDSNQNYSQPIGYIFNTINLTYFEAFMSSITIGETGHGILLDVDGNILYHPDQNKIGTPISSDRLSGILDEYNQGQILSSGIFKYNDGAAKRLYAYTIIPELGWTLLVNQNISEINSLTSIILSLLFFACAILLVVIIIFAHSLTQRFTKPIIALRDAMRVASDGNLTVQSNIKCKNELGELSKSFNKMLHIIKTNYEDLESMHEELLSNEEQLRNNYDHIEYLAYHDTLTNMPNKLAFLDYVNAALLSSSEDKQMHVVYFVDLDNFKNVNDTLGHEFGDSLLIKTAQLLTLLLEGNGMLARAGGDEFLIFRENITSRQAALDFAALMIESFRSPLDLGGEIVYLSMSIGIAIYPDNGLTPNTLIKNADIAMYKSKDTGKNRFTLFDLKMEEELNRNTMIMEILRTAIDNKEIYIKYQPLMEIETNTIIGYEALMRIKNDRLGPLAPEEFIPVAEESGQIIELSSWLISEACLFNKRLIDKGIPPRPVSVNISSVLINRPGFISLISNILKETGLPAQYLELEITESTLVSSIMDATQLLKSLQEIGVRLSLDDFGTGYSSLNYLTNMPINTLKIDKSFIENIVTSEKDAGIAKTIIELAHSLNIKVVAEGVEHIEQLEILRAQKCDIIQGFIFGKPLHPATLIDLITKE